MQFVARPTGHGKQRLEWRLRPRCITTITAAVCRVPSPYTIPKATNVCSRETFSGRPYGKAGQGKECGGRRLQNSIGMPRAIAMNRQAMPEASSTTATISGRRLPALRLCGVSTAIGAHQLLPTTITVHCGAAVDTAATPAATPS